jgi:hypothetical protein
LYDVRCGGEVEDLRGVLQAGSVEAFPFAEVGTELLEERKNVKGEAEVRTCVVLSPTNGKDAIQTWVMAPEEVLAPLKARPFWPEKASKKKRDTREHG